MILSIENPPEWTSDNAAELSGFLKSDTGVKLIELLAFLSPSLLDGADVNKTLVTSGQVKGYAEAVSQIFSLQTVRPVEARGIPDQYPDLDNDSLHDDMPQTPSEP
jgi:hypothetical protein